MNKRKIKYDYSNPESQKLLEGFSLLLGEITKHMEEREMYIYDLEYKLSKKSPIKHFIKSFITNLVKVVYKVLKNIGILYLVKRILKKLPQSENFVENIRNKIKN